MMFVRIQPDLSEQPGGSLAEHIEAIGFLPRGLAERFWRKVITPEALEEELIGEGSKYFILSTEYQQGLQTLLAHLEFKYLTLAEWLEYYLCNTQQSDLFDSEKIHYQPFAKYVLAKLGLCQEMHPKEERLQAEGSPASWWLNWVASELWWELYQRFQGKNPIEGKRKWYNLARQASHPYEHQHEGNPIARPKPPQPGKEVPAEAKEISPALTALFLEDLCAAEASTNPTFDREHYQKYLRAQRAFHNACRNSPQMQIGSISPDGQLQMSRKDKQVSKSRRREL